MHKNFVYRPSCELCGSDEKVILFSKEFIDPLVWNFLESYYGRRVAKDDLEGAKYEIAKCSDCGFIWQAHILNKEMMKKLYSTWILPEQSLLKKESADIALFTGYAREAQNIFFLLSKKCFEISVLDFGMGWGYWCQMAKAFGYSVSGFEISKERIEFARKNGIDVIENLDDAATRKFDFINAEQVFEHIANPLSTLKTLASSLNKKGVIRISVPNGRDIERKISKPGWKVSKNSIHPLEHINCFTHKTLIKFGEAAGLELIKQPFLTSNKLGLESYVKGIFKKYYKQLFSTSLYFRKA